MIENLKLAALLLGIFSYCTVLLFVASYLGNPMIAVIGVASCWVVLGGMK